MPVDLAKINQDKEKIISFVRNKGPSLPIHIAKAANLSALFASAFLSELFAEGKIKMSNMKIGSSSLYYLPGQEPQLENFTDYLNQKEKEALNLLKERKLLKDDEQVPAIRVALRAIKDFAIPIKINSPGEQKNYWRYFNSKDEEITTKANEKLNEEKSLTNEKEKTPQEKVENINDAAPIKKERKKTKTESSDFLNKIKEHFQQKDVEINTILLEKKKEFWAIVRANTVFGKQEYYIIAKDKKKISEQEIDQALERSQSEKMPVLILAPGELDKKAAMRILSLRNLIKFVNLNQ